MDKRSPGNRIWLFGTFLILASIACQTLFPSSVAPGSLEAQVAEGDIHFKGFGNVTYIGCQDPTAVVTIYIGTKTRNIDGVDFEVDVNPVSVNSITNGTQVKTDQCEKASLDDKYDWPAKGIYYPGDGWILLTTCTQNNDEAEGKLFLVGDGFEGEYACYDRNTGGLIYEVAVSAYQLVKYTPLNCFLF